MLFNSFAFVIFFIAVTAFYFLLPHKFRWAWLLAASCFFYMFFKPVYILILGFTIVIDYIAGILLEQEQDQKRKKRYLIMSLIANVGVLAVFKYYNFLNGNITGIASMLGYKNQIPYLNILLPIGLSFHTFQAMSYTIEVYRGNQKAERHFGIYSLYVMFYPQLVAGPIERPQNMLHQFHEKKFFNYDNAVTGLRLMMWGMFKKVVIADRLAPITDQVFNNPHAHSATSIYLAAVLFTFQIYCDFSGYSDIALGSARVMGFSLMKNFDRPFSSKSIGEHWRRWHISLSTWFKDYMYIPLGGNRVSKVRANFNMFIVFLVSGLWHGANWTYIVWGSLHGFYLVFANLTEKYRRRLRDLTGISSIKWLDNALQQATVFVLLNLAFIIFRANNMQTALYMLGRVPYMFGEWADWVKTKAPVLTLSISNARLLLCFAVIGVMELVHRFQKTRSMNTLVQAQPRYVRWTAYYVFLFTIIYLGVFHNTQFIYFQF
jgi:D-alanyl-lipoteichoic acid acyltransferase DltB (MBOAT superfamily)